MTRHVAMLDLRREGEVYGDAIRTAMNEVLDSAQFVNGPAVMQLEKSVAQRVGVRYAVAVSSGSDALLCALMALDIGVGDEVLVPTFTFFATAGVVSRLGATPVFVDIDSRTFNLDPAKLEAAITARTRAIMAVHLFGQCAEMDAINAIASRHGLTVIEDAAQAIGAAYQGRPACSLGDVSCLSFYPTKNLGGIGEGGMILTDREEIAGFARALRNHGESRRYVHDHVGGNFRLDTVQAAALMVKLAHLEDFTRRRRAHAARYDELLAALPVVTPFVPPGNRPVYHQYSILCDRRDALAKHLGEGQVATGVYYPFPLHRQPCFASLGYAEGALPVAERVSGEILSLPCHPMLDGDDIAYVASSIVRFFGEASPRSGGPAGRDRADEVRS